MELHVPHAIVDFILTPKILANPAHQPWTNAHNAPVQLSALHVSPGITSIVLTSVLLVHQQWISVCNAPVQLFVLHARMDITSIVLINAQLVQPYQIV
jgi:hypothetical protein